jgi:tetratricopeptide (TPR) repeat protein
MEVWVMPTIQSRAIQLLIDASKLLLNALQQDDHELARCTSRVRQLIEQGARHGQLKEYQEALNCFTQAAELDPKYIGSKMRMVKTYKATGNHAKALYIGGMAILLSNNKKIRAQIFDLLGQISKELFSVAPTESHISDSIDFYHQAISEDREDILPRWNLVCAYISAGIQLESITKRRREEYMERAKRSFTDVLKLLDGGAGESRYFINDIIADAQRQFRDLDPWWSEQLISLNRIKSRMQLEIDRLSQPASREASANLSLKQALLVATLALAIAGTTIAIPIVNQALHHQTDKAPSPSKVGALVPRVYELQLDEHPQLAEVERSWDRLNKRQLVEIERPWDRLEGNMTLERDWTRLA